ncbi:MAG: response regulator [Acidobacteria bacterium]|nr:response regulator [Acidobacteriota bacterium]
MTGILVVEDEQSVAGALGMILEDSGFLVRLASTGREGIALARVLAFDVTISDYHLPDITGIEVLKAVLRLNPRGATILITAHSTPELVAEATACGVHTVLKKPFPPSEILSLVKSLVGRG